jgi:hypothetical protein
MACCWMYAVGPARAMVHNAVTPWCRLTLGPWGVRHHLLIGQLKVDGSALMRLVLTALQSMDVPSSAQLVVVSVWSTQVVLTSARMLTGATSGCRKVWPGHAAL